MTCYHLVVEPVTLSTGEVVAKVCTNCYAQMEPWFGCPECDVEAVYTLDRVEPISLVRIHRCEEHP